MARQPATTLIKEVRLTNFRAFRRTKDVPFGPLTYLVGPNSSGKSSLFSAVLFVSQSAQQATEQFYRGAVEIITPLVRGPLVDLGSYRDMVYNHDQTSEVSITITMPSAAFDWSYWARGRRRRGRGESLIKLTFRICAAADQVGARVRQSVVTDLQSGIKVVVARNRRREATATIMSMGKSKRISPVKPAYYASRLSAALLQSSKSIPSGPESQAVARLADAISPFGMSMALGSFRHATSARSAPERAYSREGAAVLPRGQAVFNEVRPSWFPLTEAKTRRRPAKEDLASVEELAAVLRELDIGHGVRRTQLSAYHCSIEVMDRHTRVWSNLSDVGYGASQVMPVLAAYFTRARGPLFFEQPEIHLHPKAQVLVARLLAEESNRRQVVVETHSVHMINQARLMVAEGKLPAGNVVVNYVYRDKRGSHVETIGLNEHGEFTKPWPKGFFDERFQDTLKLLQLKRSSKVRK